MANRSAEILFKDRRSGTLVETADRGTRFTYGPDWLEDIAVCFPIARREHEWSNGLHPYFQHLCPEGWLRERQARAAKIDENDDFGILLNYGSDCIGAVSLRPAPGTAELTEVQEPTANPNRTFSGVQKKLLVVKDTKGDCFRPAGPTGPALYLAKFNSQDLDTLVRNEALSLRWITAVLGREQVTGFAQAWVAEVDEVALVVTRFDRGPQGEKRRQEDFAQILCKPVTPDLMSKYAAAYEDVGDVIRRHSARPSIDLDRFYRRLIAYVLIGNCDAHLKNFSLLETPTGLRLSPAYDVVNTALYPEYDRSLALSVGGRRVALDDVDRTILKKFGQEIGLSARAIELAFEGLGRQVRKASPIIAPPAAEPADGFVTRFAEIVNQSCLRILAD